MALVAGVAAAAWAQALHTLRYNGQTISGSVRVIGVRPWVPLSDASRLVGGTAVRTGGGYKIHGLRGTDGKRMFTGKWRFEVTDIVYVDSYASKHQPTDPLTPAGAGDQLAVIRCVIRNGVPQSRRSSCAWQTR